MPIYRIIFCLDLDAFFASVEELLHPEWCGKPILVGGRPEERGVVASCSYAARKFGVHSAMPMAQALRLCPQAIVTSSRHGLYSDYSRRVMDAVREYGCPMEQLSVDEVFLDASECVATWGGALALGADIKQRVHQVTGLRCTIGIASNKLVAKIASNQAKPDGLLQVPAGEEAYFLASLPISKLWGVGPKNAARLEAMGIRTIGQLQTAPLDRLKQEFGLWGWDLQRKAHGLDSSPVQTEHAVKSISRETTFVHDVGDLAELKRVALAFSEQVGRDLRAESLLARTVAIKLRWPDFQTITRQTTLAYPTDATTDIYQAAAALLETALKGGGKVRLLGVRAANLVEGRQLGLFDEAVDEKHSKADKAVDEIRERFGKDAVRRASLIRRVQGGDV